MKIGIIGGGASGMMLAAMIKGHDVTIIEKNNKLGKKLLLTGNGKCNFTNEDFSDLDKIYNNDLIRNLYKKYDNKSFIEFMKSIGIVPKIEIHKGIGYYYPNSNKSTSVYYALFDKIKENGVKILYDTEIKSYDDIKKYGFDKIVFATGGMSYKNTGSDGKIFKIIKSLGHKVVKPIPGLCGLKTNDFNLKGVRADGVINGEEGEIQFTEYGLSGILIMNISREVNRKLSEGENVTISIDFAKDIDLYKRKIDIGYKNAEDFLCGYLPDELAKTVLKRSGVKCKLVKDIDNIDVIESNIKDFKVNITGFMDFDSAQVTLGGVDISEVDPDTLESKFVPNIHFMGECLDIDGKCGGYNMQACYSTARGVLYGLQS